MNAAGTIAIFGNRGELSLIDASFESHPITITVHRDLKLLEFSIKFRSVKFNSERYTRNRYSRPRGFPIRRPFLQISEPLGDISYIERTPGSTSDIKWLNQLALVSSELSISIASIFIRTQFTSQLINSPECALTREMDPRDTLASR